jgi:hypothetical protein
MTLMYSEVGGQEQGYVVLESIYRRPDKRYAEGHAFELKEINNGSLGTVQRPVREVNSLQLPGVTITDQRLSKEAGGWRRSFTIELPANSPILRLAIPKAAALSKAWINGELALDTAIETKYKREIDTLQVVYPGDAPMEINLLTGSSDAFKMAVVTWHELPGVLVAPFMGNWPDDAKPFLYGPRAEKIQEFEFGAAESTE